MPLQNDNLKIKVVDNPTDLVKVYALRSIVYIAGQKCPYDEEFDGNDYSGSTHLLASIDNEPVGTIRLRWFADFVKVERAAVNPNFRGADIMKRIANYARQLANTKGYSVFLIHAQKHLEPYWNSVGFYRRENRDSFVYSGYEYIEMMFEEFEINNLINFDANPMILNRPEGQWHKEGVLEKSTGQSSR